MVRVYSVKEERLLFTLEGHTDWAEVVAWSSDGLHIASGAFEKDASIIIWNAVKGTELLACKGHTDRVLALDFHPDGDALVSGGSDGSARVWRVSSADCERTLATFPSEVNSAVFCHTGVMVALGCADGAVYVYEFFSGDQLFFFQHDKHWVYSLAWSPLDTHIVAGSEDHTVRLTELAQFPTGTDSDSEGSVVMRGANGTQNGSSAFVPGFQLDSPVFSVSWHEEQGLICGCASGRLVQLSVVIEKGRRSTLAWAKSFRRTKRFSKSFRFMSGMSEDDGNDEDDGVAEEDDGNEDIVLADAAPRQSTEQSTRPSSMVSNMSTRPLTVHPPIEVPVVTDDEINGTKRSLRVQPASVKSKSSVCALL